MEQSKELRNLIKSNSGNIIDVIVKSLKSELYQLPFSSIFTNDTPLIPIPKSSLMRPNSLWVPLEICKSLENNHLGKTFQLLSRRTPLPPSSRSKPEDRPAPQQHYDSLACKKVITKINYPKIVLVDDIVTRGHTLLGAAWRVSEIFPNKEIIAFALMRTISNPEEFRAIKDPVEGVIIFRPDKGDALRRP